MEPTVPGGSHSAAGERYRFDGVLVDTAAHTLSRDGAPLTVEPKAFAVLLELLRHRGELVARDDLLDRVWGHRHVTPGVLTRAIAQLRAALGDHAHEPRYILTQHALGYRFVGEVETVELVPHPEPDVPAGTPAPVATPPGAPVAPAAAAAPDPPSTPTAGPPPVDAGAMVPVAAGKAGRLRVRHAWMAIAAILALALVASLWWQRGPPVARPADASVAILPFDSLSDRREDDYFARGLAVEMHDALAGVPGLKVAASQSVEALQRHDPGPQALGRTLGVATILDASVRRDGRRVRINARLVDTASGFTLWSDSFDRELDDVFAVQGEIAAEVTRKLLGVLPQGGEGLRARLAPTGELAAYDAYLKGRDQLAGAQGDASLEAAIGHFRRALMIDRGFSRASAGICRIEIKRFEANRGAAAFERARTACDEAARMAPELREVSLALGEMHRVRGDGDAAAEQYTRALDDLSLRPAAWVGLARLRSAGGDDALAREYFRRALELRPGDPGIHRELGLHQYSTGDIEGAIASFLTATTLLPDDATLWSSVGGLYLASGDSERAVDAFHRSLAIAPSYGALSNLGTLRYGQGEYAEAAELYRQAAALDPGDFRIWGNIGDALAAAGDAPEASASAYARAVGLAEEYLAIKRDDAQASALLGWYQANLGQATQARAQLAAAESLDTEHAEVALINAQTLALLGEPGAARERVARARLAGIAEVRIDAAPALRELGTSARSQAGERGGTR